jgi:ABC-type multidrug transport system permease subunit
MGNFQVASFTNIIIVVALIIYMIYIQVAERRFKAKKYIVFPIIFIWFTISTLENIKGGIEKIAPGIIMLIVIGLICGVIAGFIAKIYRKEDGNLYIKGGWQMLLFLIISLPIRMILSHLITSLPQDIGLDYATAYLIRLTFVYIGRAIVIYMRVPDFWNVFHSQREERKLRKRLRRERGKRYSS